MKIKTLAIATVATFCFAPVANADPFLNISGSNGTQVYSTFASGANLLNGSPTINTGASVPWEADGYFAENGTWYQISGTTWKSYASSVDLALDNSSTGTGSSNWQSDLGYFAADDVYYVIDDLNHWRQYDSAADLFSGAPPTATGTSVQFFTDGFFATDGDYYALSGFNYKQFATAADLFADTNIVGTGTSAFGNGTGFAADIAAVPEPSSLAALAVLGAGAIGARRRRKA